MRPTTLVLVFNPQNQILLCMKKRGFGVWKFNGAGGKVEAGEAILEAASRELYEETKIQISPEHFENHGHIYFIFPDKPDWDQDMTVFVAKEYSWEFEETEEMKPQWFDISDIPYEKMWEDDAIWLPRVLQGETVEYRFEFNIDGHITKQTRII